MLVLALQFQPIQRLNDVVARGLLGGALLSRRQPVSLLGAFFARIELSFELDDVILDLLLLHDVLVVNDTQIVQRGLVVDDVLLQLRVVVHE